MTTNKKQVWKTVALVAGIVLVVGAIVIIIYQQHKKKNEEETGDENPYVPTSKPHVASSGSSGSGTGGLNFTKDEIKQMQQWLLNLGYFGQNQVIIQAINGSGGIDGVIGSGFNKALNEAIRLGWVKDLKELYFTIQLQAK